MLHQIQSELKVPKNQVNSFGGYKYRSCEDIVEAVKPIIHKRGFYLILTDEMVQLGERYYVKATATLTNGTETYQTSAFAREDFERKKSDGSQLTGSASTYARKYALNGLFAIDDTKDADATNTHGKDDVPFGIENGINNIPDEGERQILRNLVYSSDLLPDEKEAAMSSIELLTNYDQYQRIEYKLLSRQPGFENVTNPSQKDINKIVKQKIKA